MLRIRTLGAGLAASLLALAAGAGSASAADLSQPTYNAPQSAYAPAPAWTYYASVWDSAGYLDALFGNATTAPGPTHQTGCDALEQSLSGCGELEQELAPEYIDADMLHNESQRLSGHLLRRQPEVWDRGAGKVESRAPTIRNHLDDVRIEVLLDIEHLTAKRGDARPIIEEQSRDAVIDHLRFKQRLIALNVGDDFHVELRRHLGDTVGAGAVSGIGHHRLAAKRLDGIDDAAVICGDDRGFDGVGGIHPFVNVLDHGLAGNHRQGFAGQALRPVSCRYNC